MNKAVALINTLQLLQNSEQRRFLAERTFRNLAANLIHLITQAVQLIATLA